MSNCTISADNRRACTKPTPSCRKTACIPCRRDMAFVPGNPETRLTNQPAQQQDIIHDFVQRLERSIVKNSGS